MKKEIRVHIYSHGSNNDAILTMIGNHNSGKVKINLQTIASYIDARVAQYPGSDKDKFVYTYSPEINTLDISEDGFKSFTLQLVEVEVHELKDDIEENPVYELNKN